MPQTVKKSRVTVTLAVIVLSAAAIAVETMAVEQPKILPNVGYHHTACNAAVFCPV